MDCNFLIKWATDGIKVCEALLKNKDFLEIRLYLEGQKKVYKEIKALCEKELE